MPYTIKKQGNRYCVAKRDTGEVVPNTCHDVKQDAIDQMVAIMLSEAKQSKAKMSVEFAGTKPGVKEGAPKSPPQGYPTSADDYGDPVNWRYRLDGKNYVLAAWRYINMPRNQKQYSAAEVTFIKDRIQARGRKYGLSLKEGDARMAVFAEAGELSSEAWEEDGLVYRAGLLFRAGSYPDKEFELAPDEMAFAAQAFQACDIDSQHYESVFDGKLGRLVAVDVSEDGEELLGVTALPKWLHKILGPEPIKVSTTWDHETKTLQGLALVTSPRVEDACLMAAFSAAHPGALEAFARARHDTPSGQQALQDMHDMAARAGAVCKQPGAQMASRHEANRFQQIHDIATEGGARCASMPDGAARVMPSYYSQELPTTARPASGSGTAAPARQERRKMNPIERLKAFLGHVETQGDVPFSETVPIDPLTPPPAPVTPPVGAGSPPPAPPPGSPTSQEASFSAEVAKLKAEFDAKLAAELKSRDEQLATQAAALAAAEKKRTDADAERCADELIRGAKALPAERETLVALFRQAAEDDQRQPAEVTFGKNADGTEQKGGRVALLMAHYQARPCHQLFSEFTAGKIPANVQVLLNQDTPQPNAVNEEQKRAMLAATDSGKALLKKMDAERNGAANGRGV